jgi:inosose dehydratase
MKVRLANAPVSWGVDYPNDPKNPPWRRVMSEIREAGYCYTELGPFGYYPTDADRLREEFASRGLTVVAGLVFEALHDPAARDAIIASVVPTLKLLSAVGGKQFFIIDRISPERIAAAGRREARQCLDVVHFKAMIDLIDAIADLALGFGVQSVIHQHAGCYIEYEDELESVLAALDPAKVGICLDTGHMIYAGIDPVAFYRRHQARVWYLHFKDIDPIVHARVLREKVSFHGAIEAKIFVPLGKGVVRWRELAQALAAGGYDGVATVEQDIDPATSLTPLQDAQASLAFLRSVGF